VKLSNIIKLEKPNVLTLDPLLYFHSCNENDNAEMSIVMNNLRRLTNEYNISIVLVHHTKKPGEHPMETGLALRGASIIFGSVDTSMILAKEKLPEGLYYSLDFDIRNDEPVDKMFLELEPEILWFLKTDQTEIRTVEQWIMDTLTEARELGIKQTDLVELGKETGYAERTIRRKIATLVKQDRIKTDKKQRARTLYHHVFSDEIPF